jgi:hypothetical protein
MRSIFDIHDYDEHFLEQFTSQTIPIYDLWSVRPLQNDQKEIVAGTSDEVDKFRNFIDDHSNQDFPHPLVIVVGNAEKSNTDRMSNTSKRYFKLKFEKFKGNDLGQPLTISGAQPQPYPQNEYMPMMFNGTTPASNKNLQTPMPGFSLGEIHNIIDRNVADATRTIKAEYEEQSARREADNIKRLAELETRMEMYKLELRARELERKEQELNGLIEELEQKQLEGMGTVKDYTKTIAGGLMELGKTAFGLDDRHSSDSLKTKPSDSSSKNTKPSNSLGNTITDDGFSEVSANNKNSDDSLDQILQGIAHLDDQQKEALLDALLSESDIEEESKINDELQDNANTDEADIKQSEA